jgi:hypothetical protein
MCHAQWWIVASQLSVIASSTGQRLVLQHTLQGTQVELILTHCMVLGLLCAGGG